MDWSGLGTNFFRLSASLVVHVFETKGGKLLLMMKTKGCEEKWDFVKSLCKNLIKRTTWYFFQQFFWWMEGRGRAGADGGEEEESRNCCGETRTVNFLLFSALWKTWFLFKFFAFFLRVQSSSAVLQRIFLKRKQKDIELEKYKWHFDYFLNFLPSFCGAELDPK